MDILFQPLIIEVCNILSKNKQTIFTLQLFLSVSKIHYNIIRPKLLEIANRSYKTRDIVNYINIHPNNFINYLEYLKNTDLIYSSYWHTKYELKYKFYIPKGSMEHGFNCLDLNINNIHSILGYNNLIQIYRFTEPGLILYSDIKVADKRFKIYNDLTFNLEYSWCSKFLLNFF